MAGETFGGWGLGRDGFGLQCLVHGDADTLGGFAAALGLPHLEEDHGQGDGDDGGEDLGEVVHGCAADDDLGGSEDDADEQAERPHLPDALAAVHDGQHEEGHHQAEHGTHPGGDRGDVGDVEPTGLGGHEHRQTDGAEGHRNGVGDQGRHCGTQLAEADGNEHGGGDGHRGTEAGQGLEQTAEAEGDEDAEHTRVVTDEEEGAAQVVETTRDHRHLVHPDGTQQDPHDGEQTVEETLHTAGECRTERHPEGGDRHDEGDEPREEAGPVGFPSQSAQGDEHGKNG